MLEDDARLPNCRLCDDKSPVTNITADHRLVSRQHLPSPNELWAGLSSACLISCPCYLDITWATITVWVYGRVVEHSPLSIVAKIDLSNSTCCIKLLFVFITTTPPLATQTAASGRWLGKNGPDLAHTTLIIKMYNVHEFRCWEPPSKE